jgi:uncharacterized damage-inducible protein DinB
MNNQPNNFPVSSPVADHLAALNKSFAVFEDAAGRYSRELVRKKPSASAFSATEIVYHMLDVEKLWQRRIHGLLDNTVTHFQAMDPDKEAAEQKYNEKDYGAGIEALKQARNETYRLIRSMSNTELELTGIHSKYGSMNIRRILEIMEGHDRTHAAQLDRTLTAVSTTQQHTL